MRQGSPSLSLDDLLLDWPLFQELLQRVISAFAEFGFATPKQADRLAQIASDLPLLQQKVRDWYNGVSARGNLQELLMAAIQASLYPFLAAQSEVVLVSIDQEGWRRGFCPVCGGMPDFAFLDKEPGARWLLCSRCDAQWLFHRLECPFCGNKNQDSLAYFTDDEGLYRLYICESCRSYLKAIDLRRTQAEVILPLERLLTADLDRQGREEGYRPGRPRRGSRPRARQSRTGG